jgi:methionyl aminopeptidase
MKIHQDDIAWYLKVAPHLGHAIQGAAERVEYCTKDEEIPSAEIEKEFVSRILNYNPEAEFPFASQLNSLGEPFERAICISVNNCVAHGKAPAPIKKHDTVSLDGGMSLVAPSGRRMYFDAAVTIMAGHRYSSRKNLLAEAPLIALKAISKLKDALNTAQISALIEVVGRKLGFGIVTGLTGHGMGYELHCQPRISNVATPNMISPVIPGTLICPEPMYTIQGEGEPVRSYLDCDGWSVMVDSVSSHWETTFYYDGKTLVDTVGITNNY